MSNSKTYRTHYVPVSLLKHFTGDDGILRVFHIQEKRWSKIGPKGVGFEYDMYSREVETWFQREIESPAGRVFKRIRDGETDLVHDERLKVARFMSAQVFRTPLAREKITSEDPATVVEVLKDELSVASTLEGLLQRSLTLDEMANLRRIAWLSRNSPEIALLEIQGLENSFLSHLVQLEARDVKGADIAKQDIDFFMRLAWRFITSETEEFILSDNPVIRMPQVPPGVDDPEFECVMPISKKVAIHLGRDRIASGGTVELIHSDRAVRTINSRTLSSAYRYVYSSRERSWISKGAKRKTARNPHLRFSQERIDVQFGRPPCPDCGMNLTLAQWNEWEGEAPSIRGYKGAPPHSCR